MPAQPLIRTRWSNERIMTALLLVLVLYNLPRWVAAPAEIRTALLLIACALAADTAANYIRFRRPVCAVSAAVTAGVLYTLSPGVPFWSELAACLAALLAGKQVWGGTGKNPLNPAMVGLLVLGLLFRGPWPAFPASWLLLPAILLSLPFLLFRPFAALGMLGGLLVALALRQELSPANLVVLGVPFWCCLVITDPVTTTDQPAPGAGIGILAGFLPVLAGGTAVAMAAGILAANILSRLADRLIHQPGCSWRLRFGRRQRLQPVAGEASFLDLAGDPEPTRLAVDPAVPNPGQLSAEEILQRIEHSGICGLGGAGFPTSRKIQAVQASMAAEKHLIVNAVACDPGLLQDQWLLAQHADEIIQGIDLLGRCLPFSTVTLAARNTAGLAFPAPIRLHRVPDFYPAGAEGLLIRETLGRTLDSGAIPANEGILVLNVQTIYNLNQAVRLNRPADTRLLTIADLTRRTGQVARVRLGAGVQEILDRVRPGLVGAHIGGGLMEARLVADDDRTDVKVSLIATGRAARFKESPQCSRCGLCGAVCPVHLPVREIAAAVDDGKPESAARYHPENCLNCGACSFVCLAGRNLAGRVRTLALGRRLQPKTGQSPAAD